MSPSPSVLRRNLGEGVFTQTQGTYLLSHSVGRMPMSAQACAQANFFDAWENATPDPWGQWMSVFDDFRQAVAALLNARADEVCPQTNVSSALSKIIQALPQRVGKNVIVMTENDFPSIGFVLQQAQQQGYQLRIIKASQDPQNLDTWEHALKDDVACVLITHVHYNTNRLIAVKEICELARARDIISIIDIAQSAGIVPIDLQRWQADVVVGSCVKWLCGGPGAGFLWVHRDCIHEFTPTDVGWFSHQNPFEFDIGHFQYADDAKRFWGGTPSVLPYTLAANSINTLLNIGLEDIYSHNRQLNRIITDQLAPQSLKAPLDDKRRGGTLVIKLTQQQKAIDALLAAGVHFDSRPMGLRLSPHLYNTQADAERVADILKDY